jgi:hypothetical protein
VGKRGGHEALDIDLADPLRPGRGEQGMLLDERQCIAHGCLMGPFTGATAGSATAHNLDTDFTGENVRS